MENAAPLGQEEKGPGSPGVQQAAADHGGMRGGGRLGGRSPHGKIVSGVQREAEGGSSQPVFLDVCRRSPGGAHPDPWRPGFGEPLSHPPGRGPLRPRGARRAGAEGEEARLGK